MGSMSMDSNFEELLSLFIARGVRFLVVGGYAYSSHGTPRGTKDLDLWVEPTTENAKRTWRALAEFGMALGDIKARDLAKRGPWLQFGRAPKRVDILTAVDGLEFAGAWERRVFRPFGRVSAPVLSIDDLILNKRLVGRPRDRADVAVLERRRAEDADEGRVSDSTAPRRRRRVRNAQRRRSAKDPRR
jgi:hypothetical protein